MTVSLESGSRVVEGLRMRILRVAGEQFFSRGFSGLTMEDLAIELGMSKKTLYVHFTSKDTLVRELIEGFGREVHANADAILRDSKLSFLQKLRRQVEWLLQRLARMDQRLLRDLERFSPAHFVQLQELRRQNIPYVFGRLLKVGQRQRKVRSGLDVAFASEFLLHGMQGLLLPTTLEHLQARPVEVFEKAMELFFGGLLTNAGRDDYEKLFSR